MNVANFSPLSVQVAQLEQWVDRVMDEMADWMAHWNDAVEEAIGGEDETEGVRILGRLRALRKQTRDLDHGAKKRLLSRQHFGLPTCFKLERQECSMSADASTQTPIQELRSSSCQTDNYWVLVPGHIQSTNAVDLSQPKTTTTSTQIDCKPGRLQLDCKPLVQSKVPLNSAYYATAFQCPHCDLSFSHLASLEDHMTKHINRIGPIFLCPYCIRSFAHSGHRNRHVRLMHRT